MEPSVILIVLLVIISMGFLFDQFLDFLNLKSQRDDIPESMKEYYDEEKYKKSQDYQRMGTRFSFITSLASCCIF